MCVIASIPAGKDINNDTIDRMWKRNPDGGGISWIEDGKVQVFKTMKLKPFKQKFKEVLSKYGDSDILVHMRIATHGSVCIENNHPFYIDTQTVFAHNGIMPSEFHPPAKSDLSDTRYFNQVFLQNIKPVALDDELFRQAVGDIIGSFNKLVILSANKKLQKESYIINERSGQWVKGVWYSNTSHEPSTIRTYGNYAQPVQRTFDDEWHMQYEDCAYNDPYFFGDEVDEPMWMAFSTLIPAEDWEDMKCSEEIEAFVETVCQYEYESLDDAMADYNLDWQDKKFICRDCKKHVVMNWGRMKRNCTKKCSSKELV